VTESKLGGRTKRARIEAQVNAGPQDPTKKRLHHLWAEAKEETSPVSKFWGIGESSQAWWKLLWTEVLVA
jgi:hypothetical protein